MSKVTNIRTPRGGDAAADKALRNRVSTKESTRHSSISPKKNVVIHSLAGDPIKTAHISQSKGAVSKRRTIVGDYYLRSRNIVPPSTVSGLKYVHRSRSAGSSHGGRGGQSPRGRGGLQPGERSVSTPGPGGLSPQGQGSSSSKGRGGGAVVRGRPSLVQSARVKQESSKSGGRVKTTTMSVKRKAVRSASPIASLSHKKRASEIITPLKKTPVPVQILRRRTFHSPPVVRKTKASESEEGDAESVELTLPTFSGKVVSQQRVTTTTYSRAEPALIVTSEGGVKKRKHDEDVEEDSDEEHVDEEVDVRTTLKRIRPDVLDSSNEEKSPVQTTKSTSMSGFEFARPTPVRDKHYEEINKNSISIESSKSSSSSKGHHGMGASAFDDLKGRRESSGRVLDKSGHASPGRSSVGLLAADQLKWEMTGSRSKLIDRLYSNQSGSGKKFNASVEEGRSIISQTQRIVKSGISCAPRDPDKQDQRNTTVLRRSTSRSSSIVHSASGESSTCLSYVIAADGDDSSRQLLAASSRVTRSTSRGRMGGVSEGEGLRNRYTTPGKGEAPGRACETPGAGDGRDRGGGESDPALRDGGKRERGGGDSKVDALITDDLDVPGNGDIFSRIDDYPDSTMIGVGRPSRVSLTQRTRVVCVCMISVILILIVLCLVGRFLLSYLYDS